MKLVNRILPFAAAAAALTALAAPAQATTNISGVTTVVATAPSGSFGDTPIVCGDVAGCTFTDTGTFITPVGYNLVSATISSTAIIPNALSFTSVMLNGMAFDLFSNPPGGVFNFGSLAPLVLGNGATNTLSVSGTVSGSAGYNGILAFGQRSDVPEPSTWGLMLLGFGAMGFSLRRRRRSVPNLMQAV